MKVFTRRSALFLGAAAWGLTIIPAFSVENDYRKQGLGQRLFGRIAEAARNHGVEVIEIVCLPENAAMRRLAAKFSAEFTFADNQLLGKLTARRPTAYSMFREAARDAADFGEALFDAQMRALRAGASPA